MRDLGAVGIVAGDVEILQDAERHAGSDALTRRRDLVQGRAAIAEADGIDPVGLVRGEVFLAESPAGFLGVLVHRLGEFAAIEGLAVALGDLLERPCLVGKFPQLARLGRAAAG